MKEKKIIYSDRMIFVAVILFGLVTSCTKPKQVLDKQTNARKSYESNTLMYWTDEALLEKNLELVEVANELWSFGYGDRDIRHTFEDLLAWGDKCNEMLVEYYDAHFENKYLADEIKDDSVTNRISALYEPMINGSTIDMIIVADMECGIMQFKNARKYRKLLSMSQNSQQEVLTRTEMENWKEFSDSLCRVGANIVSLKYFGGTISGVHANSLILDFEEIRLKQDMELQLALFNGSLNLPKQNQNAQSLVQTYSDAIKQAYNKEMAEEYENYKDLHQKALTLIPVVEKLYEKWIASREALSKTLDADEAKIYNAITNSVINGLCNLIVEEE